MSDPRRSHASAPEEPAEAEFVLELPSDPRVIEGAVAYLANRLQSYSFEGPRLNLNFRVGLTEALANAVLYGNCGDASKSVRVEVALDSEQVCLCVVDQGDGFDPDAVPDPTLPHNLERPGGRGIFLIRKLMDEVEFSDRGNIVRMRLFRRQRHSEAGGDRSAE